MAPVLLRAYSASVANSNSTPMTDPSTRPVTRSSSYVQVIRPAPYGAASTSLTNDPAGRRMTASRRRPIVTGRDSSGLAAAPGAAGASPAVTRRVTGGAPEPAAAVGHWPTPAATRPTAASTARPAYLRLVQVMART